MRLDGQLLDGAVLARAQRVSYRRPKIPKSDALEASSLELASERHPIIGSNDDFC